jgi:ABC-type transporter lipoprotein component MlaA
MKHLIIFLTILLLVFSAKADDDFGDYDERPATRKVILRDSKFSKRVSIATTKGFLVVYKYALRPVLVVYRAGTTSNFRLSFNDGMNNINYLGSVVNNILIASPQRFIGSLGYVITNVSLGLGVIDIAKEFELQNYKIGFDDVLRFYYVPEGYFFLIAGTPLTLPSIGNFAVEFFPQGKYYDLFGGFWVTSALKIVNSSAINMEVLDVATNTNPEFLYSATKDYIYSYVKYFNIEGRPFKSKQQALKSYLDYKDGKLY